MHLPMHNGHQHDHRFFIQQKWMVKEEEKKYIILKIKYKIFSSRYIGCLGYII
jgi:hypothetical protein